VRFTPSEQAQKLEDVAFDLENSTSPHSGWFKFEDEAAAKIANDAAKKFRARAKQLRIQVKREIVVRAQRALELEEQS
jgi:hypothetical protein